VDDQTCKMVELRETMSEESQATMLEDDGATGSQSRTTRNHEPLLTRATSPCPSASSHHTCHPCGFLLPTCSFVPRSSSQRFQGEQEEGGGMVADGCEASQGRCGRAEAAWPAAVWCGFGGGRRERRRDGKSRERG
jgi:hypothetical protein